MAYLVGEQEHIHKSCSTKQAKTPAPRSILIQRVVLHILAMAYLVGESNCMLYQTREVKAQIPGDKLDT